MISAIDFQPMPFAPVRIHSWSVGKPRGCEKKNEKVGDRYGVNGIRRELRKTCACDCALKMEMSRVWEWRMTDNSILRDRAASAGSLTPGCDDGVAYREAVRGGITQSTGRTDCRMKTSSRFLEKGAKHVRIICYHILRDKVSKMFCHRYPWHDLVPLIVDHWKFETKHWS